MPTSRPSRWKMTGIRLTFDRCTRSCPLTQELVNNLLCESEKWMANPVKTFGTQTSFQKIPTCFRSTAQIPAFRWKHSLRTRSSRLISRPTMAYMYDMRSKSNTYYTWSSLYEYMDSAINLFAFECDNRMCPNSVLLSILLRNRVFINNYAEAENLWAWHCVRWALAVHYRKVTSAELRMFILAAAPKTCELEPDAYIPSARLRWCPPVIPYYDV